MPQPCQICAATRGLSEHLAEVAFAAQFLGNTSTYDSEHGTATIRTETIGDWFRLASQLKTVEIDAWKFEPSAGDAFYCEPVAENIGAHGKHYTTYSTALTRFMFVCNGLEEAYRLIDHLYGPLSVRKSAAKKDLKRTSSMRAVALLDDLFEREGASAAPRHFEHHCRNFIGFFNLIINRNLFEDGQIFGLNFGFCITAFHLRLGLRAGKQEKKQAYEDY